MEGEAGNETEPCHTSIDLPEVGAAEQEHLSSLSIFLILCVLGNFSVPSSSLLLDCKSLSSSFIYKLDNILSPTPEYMNEYTFFSAMCVILIFFLLKTKLNYLPESVACVIVGKFLFIVSGHSL